MMDAGRRGWVGCDPAAVIPWNSGMRDSYSSSPGLGEADPGMSRKLFQGVFVFLTRGVSLLAAEEL